MRQPGARFYYDEQYSRVTLPYRADSLYVRRVGNYIRLTTDFGADVLWNPHMYVEVQLHTRYRSKVRLKTEHNVRVHVHVVLLSSLSTHYKLSPPGVGSVRQFQRSHQRRPAHAQWRSDAGHQRVRDVMASDARGFAVCVVDTKLPGNLRHRGRLQQLCQSPVRHAQTMYVYASNKMHVNHSFNYM